MRKLLALLLVCGGAVAEPAIKKHLSAVQVPSHPFVGEGRKNVAPLPEAMEFSLVGAPRVIDGNQLALKGKISNPLGKEIVLVTFGGNEINPFSVQPEADPVYRWSTRYPLQPPAPAIPVFQRIPAHSEVEYEARFDLTRLEYDGAPTIRFEWRFGFYGQNREASSGIVSVTLPNRPASEAR